MQKYLNSHDKESSGTQFLSIGLTTTKLWLYKTLQDFMKCIFCTKFYNGVILKIQHVSLCQVSANQVTYMTLENNLLQIFDIHILHQHHHDCSQLYITCAMLLKLCY